MGQLQVHTDHCASPNPSFSLMAILQLMYFRFIGTWKLTTHNDYWKDLINVQRIFSSGVILSEQRIVTPKIIGWSVVVSSVLVPGHSCLLWSYTASRWWSWLLFRYFWTILSYSIKKVILFIELSDSSWYLCWKFNKPDQQLLPFLFYMCGYCNGFLEGFNQRACLWPF